MHSEPPPRATLRSGRSRADNRLASVPLVRPLGVLHHQDDDVLDLVEVGDIGIERGAPNSCESELSKRDIADDKRML